MEAQQLEFTNEKSFVNAVFIQVKYLNFYQQVTIVLNVLMFIQCAQNASQVIIASIL
jgi:hypothetical protein